MIYDGIRGRIERERKGQRRGVNWRERSKAKGREGKRGEEGKKV